MKKEKIMAWIIMAAITAAIIALAIAMRPLI